MLTGKRPPAGGPGAAWTSSPFGSQEELCEVFPQARRGCAAGPGQPPTIVGAALRVLQPCPTRHSSCAHNGRKQLSRPHACEGLPLSRRQPHGVLRGAAAGWVPKDLEQPGGGAHQEGSQSRSP